MMAACYPSTACNIRVFTQASRRHGYLADMISRCQVVILATPEPKLQFTRKFISCP
jgi:hypothetical protein